MKKRRINSMDTEGPRSATVPAKLSSRLEGRLASYAMAAGAAGVGLLALAPTAKADIIYTAANSPLETGSMLELNFNNDGVFGIRPVVLSDAGRRVQLIHGSIASGNLFGTAGFGNGLMLSTNGGVADLHAGALIGPSKPFASAGGMAHFDAYCLFPLSRCHISSVGEWTKKDVGFFGLKLRNLDNGQTYFGWAELSNVMIDLYTGGYNGTLVGFAYNTIPNEPIRADQGSPTPTPEPATLGLLALGLAAWRRRKTASRSREEERMASS